MTHPMKSLSLAAAMIGLAACNPQKPSTPPPAPAKSASAIAGTEVTDPRTVPAGFQGLWAATEDDCAKPTETRLVVGADHLTFYESRGPVASVEATGPDEIRIAVQLSGEGEARQATYRYRLIQNGAALFDVRSGLTRYRCPAA
jgi:hypothetical protein